MSIGPGPTMAGGLSVGMCRKLCTRVCDPPDLCGDVHCRDSCCACPGPDGISCDPWLPPCIGNPLCPKYGGDDDCLPTPLAPERCGCGFPGCDCGPGTAPIRCGFDRLSPGLSGSLPWWPGPRCCKTRDREDWILLRRAIPLNAGGPVDVPRPVAVPGPGAANSQRVKVFFPFAPEDVQGIWITCTETGVSFQSVCGFVTFNHDTTGTKHYSTPAAAGLGCTSSVTRNYQAASGSGDVPNDVTISVLTA